MTSEIDFIHRYPSVVFPSPTLLHPIIALLHPCLSHPPISRSSTLDLTDKVSLPPPPCHLPLPGLEKLLITGTRRDIKEGK